MVSLVAAKKVVLQYSLSRGYLEGTSGAYIDGVFSFNQTTYAKPAFRRALVKIHGARPQLAAQ
jgi:hypothetical protein